MNATCLPLDVFTVLLGDPARPGREEVLEVGLDPLPGDVHQLQEEREP